MCMPYLKKFLHRLLHSARENYTFYTHTYQLRIICIQTILLVTFTYEKRVEFKKFEIFRAVCLSHGTSCTPTPNL
jgi:hypothetical protein